MSVKIFAVMDEIEKIEQLSLLLDYYGGLISEKQRDFLVLYNEENLSLQEIADEYGVSRQGAYDAVKKAQKALEGYEEKLHLVEHYRQSQLELASLLEDYKEDTALCERLSKLWLLKD